MSWLKMYFLATGFGAVVLINLYLRLKNHEGVFFVGGGELFSDFAVPNLIRI